LVRQVTISAPVHVAAGVQPRREPEDPCARLRESLTAIRATERESDVAWEQVRTVAAQWTPAAQLARAMLGVITPDRLAELLPTARDGDLARALRETLLAEPISRLLDRLTDLELGAVLQAVSGVTPDEPSPRPTTRQGTIALILSGVGADARPALMGQDA